MCRAPLPLATRFALLLATLALAACTSPNRGSINGIHFEMSLNRPAVTSGVPYSLQIEMDDIRRGYLWVDGIPFGWVETGDRVLVTDDAVVLVNDEPRQPTEPPSELRRGLEPKKRTRMIED